MASRRSKGASASVIAPAAISQAAAAARLFSSAATAAAVQAASDIAQRQELSNLLASGLYHDLSRDVHSKADNLMQLLRADMPWSATQLMAMYAQLLAAIVRATPNKELTQQRARAESARPGASSSSPGSQSLDDLDAFDTLEDRPELDDDQPAAAWGVRDVAVCVELLQTTQRRMEELLNAEAGTAVTTSANGAAVATAASAGVPVSAAKSKRVSAASTAGSCSVSADDLVHIENDRIHLPWRLKPVLLRHAKSIVHLMISHFCRPEYWGSVDAAAETPPSPLHDVQPETVNRIQFFYACMQMLVALLPSVLGQLEAKEGTRVLDWLTRIVKNEVERSVRTHQREMKSARVMPASAAAVATPAATAAAASLPTSASLVRSALPCCIACSLLSRSRPRRSSFPYGSLSPSGSLAISVLAHAHHLQGLDADNASFFTLLPTHLAAPANQLTFLAHVANPLVRLHAVSVALANLFHRTRTMLYTGKNAEGLKCFHAAGARAPSLSHEQLKPQLEFVLQWLDSLVSAYGHAASDERRNLTEAVRSLRFVEETATAWAPAGPASETRRHKQATAAAEEKTSTTAAAAAASNSPAEPASKKSKTIHLKEGSVKAIFARETAAQKVAAERSKRSEEENKRMDEANKVQQILSQKQTKRQEILTKRDTASHTFRELQSLYGNLLALFGQSVAELMHDHFNEQHEKEQVGNLERREAAETSLSQRSNSDCNPCIPDSQPLTQESSAAASAMDDATPSASQVSLDADDPDEPSASQSTAASGLSKATSGSPNKRSPKRKGASSPSPSKSHSKKAVAVAPLPCQCTMIGVCETLSSLYAQVHAKLHAMQAAILAVTL